MPGATRRLWKGALLLLFVAYELLAYFVLRDSFGAAAVSGLTHACAYLVMLWYFGRTLRTGREPLITRLALNVHGSLTPEMAQHARSVTVAWCVFFAAQVTGSALLLAFAPYDLWSLFINVLNLPLLVLMFVAEHVYRSLRYPERPYVPIGRVLRAFSEVTSEPERTKAL